MANFRFIPIGKFISKVILLLLNGFFPLLAQNSDSINTVQTDEIQIVDQYLIYPHQFIHPLQTLTKQKLDKLNAITVADAVKQLAGVSLKDYGGLGGIKTLSVRSLGAEHTSVLMDGIKVSDTQNGQIDLGRFSLQNLESIELSTGIFPNPLSPAQTYTSASVLNLVSKIESFSQSSKTLDWRLGTQFGSFGFSNISASLYSKPSQSISLAIDVERFTSNGEYDYQLQNGSQTLTLQRRNSDVSSLRLEGDLAIRISPSTILLTKFYGFDSNRGLPNAVSIRPDVNLIEVSQQRLTLQDAFVQTRWQNKWKENLSTSFGAKIAYNFLRFTEPRVDPRDPNTDDQYHQRELYSTLSASYSISEHITLSLASDLAFNTLNTTVLTIGNPQRTTSISAISLSNFSKHHSIEGNLVSTQIFESNDRGQSASDRGAFTPAIAFGLKPFSEIGLQLRTSFRHSFRLPTFNDLYYSRIGNPNLLPEYARVYNAGVGYERYTTSNWKYLSIKLDGFYTMVTDKILAVPRDPFNWSMRNIGEVESKGYDVKIENAVQVFNSTVTVFGSYSRQDVIDVTPNTNTPQQQIPYTPKEMATASVGLERNHWSIGYSFTYTGFRFSLPENSSTNVLPDFIVHDINISTNYSFMNFTAKVKAELSNVFNAQYDVIQFFPMPGRSFRLSLNLTSNQE